MSSTHKYRNRNFWSVTRSAVVSTLILCFFAINYASALPPVHSKDKFWVGTWASTPSAPTDAFPGPVNEQFENQTLRQIARISVGGVAVRVELSNAGVDAPLLIGSASVAKHYIEAKVRPGSNRPLTFDGSSSVTIPAGGSVLSDPVLLPIASQTNLAISVYLPQATGPTSWHQTASQTGFVSPAGDYTDTRDMPVEAATVSRYFISKIEVLNRRSVSSIVFFGDSITDGYNSTVDSNSRFPDLIADKLNQRGCHRKIGVINQGLSGNRLLSPYLGISALDRFDRDTLGQAGVSHVVVQIGINDIGLPSAFGVPPIVEASDIIAGLTELADRGHAAGLTMYAGTLLPFAGTIFPGYYTPEGETVRQQVNDWLRTTDVFDSVIDFDAVMSDPQNPTFLLPAYSSYDGLHPNDTGYQAMADAIDLNLFD